jgi:hypothetical protein
MYLWGSALRIGDEPFVTKINQCFEAQAAVMPEKRQSRSF